MFLGGLLSSLLVWRDLEQSWPFRPVRILRIQWTWAFSLVCEVELIQLTCYLLYPLMLSNLQNCFCAINFYDIFFWKANWTRIIWIYWYDIKNFKTKIVTKIVKLGIITVIELSLRGQAEPLMKNKEKSWVLEGVSTSIIV